MEWERKEQLYMEAIGFFNEGKVGVFWHYSINIILHHMLQTWECGIRLCKELASLYEEEQFDYHKLAAILVSNA